MVGGHATPYVFVSYASADRERVLPVVAALRSAGVAAWVDEAGIPGGANYGTEIADAVKGATAVLLLCSAAALASRNVRQEILLGWRYERPYLPLLLDPVTIPDDLAYWLEGAQWVPVLARPAADWLPQALAALERLGLRATGVAAPRVTPRQAVAEAAREQPVPDTLPRPETRYARSDDLHIAYQVVGDGPIDLVFIQGMASHVEFAWEEPTYALFLRRLASFSRLIFLDKRGTGLSDRVPGIPTIEQRMDDVRAVLDAVGSERAALFGFSEGGSMCALFAATYPERTAALVLLGAFARRLWAPDYPWAPTREERQVYYDWIDGSWGRTPDVSTILPGRDRDAAFMRWGTTYQRLAASPGAALALARMNTQIDIRHVLPTIRVPTLVIQGVDDDDVRVENGRYLAEHIHGARYIELPGLGHNPIRGDHTDVVLDAVEAFLADVAPASEIDQVLTTVLATSIIGESSEPTNALLERYGALVRREVPRFRGSERHAVDNTFIATFDGPARAVRCAQALIRGAVGLGLVARAGLHTGECEVRGDQIGGFAVDLAMGVLARATPSEVLVSSTVTDLVAGSGLRFEERGVLASPGRPGQWRLFAAI